MHIFQTHSSFPPFVICPVTSNVYTIHMLHTYNELACINHLPFKIHSPNSWRPTCRGKTTMSGWRRVCRSWRNRECSSHNKYLCAVEIADWNHSAGQHLTTLYPGARRVVLISWLLLCSSQSILLIWLLNTPDIIIDGWFNRTLVLLDDLVMSISIPTELCSSVNVNSRCW